MRSSLRLAAVLSALLICVSTSLAVWKSHTKHKYIIMPQGGAPGMMMVPQAMPYMMVPQQAPGNCSGFRAGSCSGMEGGPRDTPPGDPKKGQTQARLKNLERRIDTLISSVEHRNETVPTATAKAALTDPDGLMARVRTWQESTRPEAVERKTVVPTQSPSNSTLPKIAARE